MLVAWTTLFSTFLMVSVVEICMFNRNNSAHGLCEMIPHDKAACCPSAGLISMCVQHAIAVENTHLGLWTGEHET